MSRYLIDFYKVEIHPHCEDCNLGYVRYMCPKCRELQDDFENLWWGKWSDEPVLFSCPCGAELVARGIAYVMTRQVLDPPANVGPGETLRVCGETYQVLAGDTVVSEGWVLNVVTERVLS